jgi:hypothetical protein
MTDQAGPQIQDGALGIDPVLGPVPVGPVGDEDDGGVPPRAVLGTSADRPEPLPAQDSEVESTGPARLATVADGAPEPLDLVERLATVGDEPAASLDRDARPSSSSIGRLAATVRRMAGAALALFALASIAGLPTASARPAPDRSRVREACPASASAGWLCSSRLQDPHGPGDPDGGRHRPREADAEPG